MTRNLARAPPPPSQARLLDKSRRIRASFPPLALCRRLLLPRLQGALGIPPHPPRRQGASAFSLPSSPRLCAKATRDAQQPQRLWLGCGWRERRRQQQRSGRQETWEAAFPSAASPASRSTIFLRLFSLLLGLARQPSATAPLSAPASRASFSPPPRLPRDSGVATRPAARPRGASLRPAPRKRRSLVLRLRRWHLCPQEGKHPPPADLSSSVEIIFGS